jgi:hypothetical protein
MVEQRFCKPKVAGSIPASGTIIMLPVLSENFAQNRKMPNNSHLHDICVKLLHRSPTTGAKIGERAMLPAPR